MVKNYSLSRETCKSKGWIKKINYLRDENDLLTKVKNEAATRGADHVEIVDDMKYGSVVRFSGIAYTCGNN